jgi:hypothetical protein
MAHDTAIMPARRRATLGLAALLVVSLAAPCARAANKGARERAARKACLSGDYAKGVEILSDLFIDTRDATYIFNQGRCFEQNGRCEDAITRFREYLRKAGDISPETRADTEKHIAECQAVLGAKPSPEPARESAGTSVPQSYAPPPPTVASPSPPPAVASPPPFPASAPEPSGLASAAMPAAHPGRGLRVGGLVCGVLGAAAIGTGIYFYTRATYYSDKVTGQEHWNPSDEDAGRLAETLQWVFYGAGAAALVTGTVLYWVGWRAAEPSGTTAGLAPMVGPGLAGISARGAF